MSNVKRIAKSGLRFYQKCKEEPNGRYRSWEHCYTIFHEAHMSQNVDDKFIDYLSLHLAFYLASWGMYRGSSFLLQKDYKVHSKAIKELLKPEYNSLWGISTKEYLKRDSQEKLEELVLRLKQLYFPIKKSIKKFEKSEYISDTLITKILMGTMGCTPAYDRYFVDGIKKEKIANGHYSTKSIIQLAKFYEEHFEEFESARRQMSVGRMQYSQMKLIDCCFWQIGFDMDDKKGIKEVY